MPVALLGLIFIVCLILGYKFYSNLLAKHYKLDDSNITPAHQINDGVDFVPTRLFYLLGQHFSAIAAAGPIVGPILACITFGWLPCVLWIIAGAIFIGAVHDFSTLFASVRHKALSIVEIVRGNLGRRAHIAFMLFIWLSLMYVIVAFTDVTAQTFLGKVEELEGSFKFNPGGAVAGASVMYLFLALLMGIFQKTIAPPLWLLTIIFVPLTLIVVWLGTHISTVFVFEIKTWYVLILLYCFVASLLPVWLLLQPRGYLGGFVLYLAFFCGCIGIFFGGFTIEQPIFKSWTGTRLDENLIPFLFVTIACGACSGFHGLVCSGTTSKQIDKESHCRPIGYGGMLLESFVALIALSTVIILTPQQAKSVAPGKLYGEGLAKFLTLLIGKENFIFAATFGSMAFSTFVFDTIDVATRLGRYLLQELFNSRTFTTAFFATLLTCGCPLLLLLTSKQGGWKMFWVLFGTSNQLLAGLTLLVVSVWLKNSEKTFWFTLVPSVFLIIITVISLLLHTKIAISEIVSKGIAFSPVIINGFISLILMFLVTILIYNALKRMSVSCLSR